MKTFMKYTNLILMLVILSACSGGPQIANGEVSNLYHTTAEWLIHGCENGACGSEIISNGRLTVYARPFIDNVGFIITDKFMDAEKMKNVTGNLVTTDTWSGIKQWMLDNGYKVITAGSPFFEKAVSTARNIAISGFTLLLSVDLESLDQLPDLIPDSSME